MCVCLPPILCCQHKDSFCICPNSDYSFSINIPIQTELKDTEHSQMFTNAGDCDGNRSPGPSNEDGIFWV